MSEPLLTRIRNSPAFTVLDIVSKTLVPAGVFGLLARYLGLSDQVSATIGLTSLVLLLLFFFFHDLLNTFFQRAIALLDKALSPGWFKALTVLFALTTLGSVLLWY